MSYQEKYIYPPNRVAHPTSKALNWFYNDFLPNKKAQRISMLWWSQFAHKWNIENSFSEGDRFVKLNEYDVSAIETFTDGLRQITKLENELGNYFDLYLFNTIDEDNHVKFLILNELTNDERMEFMLTYENDKS